MKYLLMAGVEREDGTTFTQCITCLDEENRNSQEFIDKAITSYRHMLGEGYQIVAKWIE